MGHPSLASQLATGLDQMQRLPTPKHSVKGQTIIVTGSNIGLGFEAARHFAKLGAARLILAVRSASKGQEAREKILESLPTTTPKDALAIEVWEVDLSSYKSVLAFCDRATRELDRIDVLLENAGILTSSYTLAEDNESTLTVNVVSTFLMAFLLLPKLRETAAKYKTKPHLTVVSSLVHFYTDLPERSGPEGGIFDKLNDAATADMKDRYSASKLMEVFVVREMARQRPTDPVVFNFVNPGLCYSSIFRDGKSRMMSLQLAVAGRSTEVGSRTLVHATQAGEASHGQYLSECKVKPVASFVRSKEGEVTQKRVYEELMGKLEKIRPGVTSNL